MERCILISPGELTLKKRNRKNFEKVLVQRIKEMSENYGNFSFKKLGARYLFTTEESEAAIDDFIGELNFVLGLKTIFKGFVTSNEFGSIKDSVLAIYRLGSSFKIQSKRHDKSFPYKSTYLNRELGGVVLESNPAAQVDLHNSQQTIFVEIFEESTLVFEFKSKGAGGLPYATTGRVVSLFSGGIDSPVASWMIMRRGCELIPLHFHTPPYTGDGSVMKVKELVKKLSDFTGKPIKTYFVNFTEIQLAVKKCVQEKYITIISRRFMGKIAQEIAAENRARGVVTGESLSQVASQTLENMLCVDEVFDISVLRPLVGLDKEEIIKKARDIRTYDISIRKETDCCHLFSPKRPETKGSLSNILKEERKVYNYLSDELKYSFQTENII